MRPAADAAIVLTGATGHVGGALLERLLDDGRDLRCVVRDASKLPVDPSTVEVVEGDLRDPATLRDALAEGCVVYYLVHALDAGGSLADEERGLAQGFAHAAREAGAARIVYLGGLVDESGGGTLSPHMESRVATGQILRGSGVQTLELRASIVIGAGSFSFELIRRAVETLPVIALPSWADTLAQPIALADVVSYLAAAAILDVDGSRVFELGGGDLVTYRRLIELVGEALGRRRLTARVPVPGVAGDVASRLAAPVAGGLPGEAQEALKLLESLRHTTVVRDDSAAVFGIEPLSLEDAIDAAIAG